jgi:HEAT repeat protein
MNPHGLLHFVDQGVENLPKRAKLLVALGVIVAIGAVLLIPQLRAALWRAIRNDRPDEGKTAKELSSELESPDPSIRAKAAKDLGRIGAEGQVAIPALCKALGDPSAEVRVQASLALTKLEPKGNSVVPALSKAVTDEIPIVRMNALLTLSRLGPDAKEAVPQLVRALRDEKNLTRIYPFPRSVFEMSVETLGQIGPDAKEAVGDLTKIMNTKEKDILKRVNVARAILKINKDLKNTLPVLIEGLNSSNFEAWDQAIETIEATGPEAKDAVPALIKVLKDKDVGNTQTQGGAARALGKIGPEAKAAVPALIAALDGKDYYVRNWAIFALGAIGREARPATDAILRVAKEGDARLDQRIKDALIQIDPEAVSRLGSK